MTTLMDGNIEALGRLVDNMLAFIANMFGGLATFGNTMGILIGLGLVLGLVLVAIGKINIGRIIGNFR
jgi:hypothetical protein